MFRFASPLTLQLSAGELLTWRQGRVRLRVLSGSAWVTRPNDLDDHVLHAGQSIELHDGLIGAETDLCVRLQRLDVGQAVARAALARVRRWLVVRQAGALSLAR